MFVSKTTLFQSFKNQSENLLHMRNKLIIVFCLTVCFILSIQHAVAAQSKSSNPPGNSIKLKFMPELNAVFPVKKRMLKNPANLLMTASGGMEPSFEAEYEGIKFLVAIGYESRRISFISTTDNRFQTGEGIRIGDTLEKVLETSKGEIIKEPGWAFFVRLKSGWNAAFVQGAEITEGELPPGAKVSFLFKR